MAPKCRHAQTLKPRSNIEHPTSNIQRPSHNRTSNIRHRTSNAEAADECCSNLIGLLHGAFDVGTFVPYSTLDVRCPMSDVRPVFDVGCSMSDVRCSSGIRCWMFDVRCWMFAPVFDVGCPMSDVRCSFPYSALDVRCPMLDVRPVFHVHSGRSSRTETEKPSIRLSASSIRSASEAMRIPIRWAGSRASRISLPRIIKSFVRP